MKSIKLFKSILPMLVVLSACADNKSLPSETLGNEVSWVDSNTITKELIVFSQDDAVVIYALDNRSEIEEKDKYALIFSGLHLAASCDAPVLTQKQRRDLVKLRNGEIESATVPSSFGDETTTYVVTGEKKMVINGSSRHVKIIRDDYTDSFVDSKTGEVVGWQEREGEKLLTLLGEVKKASEIDPVIIAYANENCDPGPIDN